MTTKLKFEVDNIELIDEVNDSQFALVQLDVFASGKNLHDMTTSVDTLKKTAKTIFLKPLVAVYDKFFDDIGSHDSKEVAIGVVPNDAEISFKELADGRTMMKVNALIWKNYCQNILGFFKRDGGSKPLSVEMDVISTRDSDNGLVELVDYAYSAITLLGSTVQPAIPGAEANIIRFALDEKMRFSKYDSLDLTIPKIVQENCQDGLDMWGEMEAGETAKTVSLSIARHLTKNPKISLEKFRQFKKYIPKNFKGGDLNSLLLGGFEGQSWFNSISEKLTELDNQHSAYFTEEEISETGDKPKDTKKKEAMSMTDEKKEEFDSQEVDMASDKEGSPAEEKKENPEEEKKEQEKMTADDEKDEDPKEEKTESPKKEDKEDKKEFSLDAYVDVPAVLAMLANETSEYAALAEECKMDVGTDVQFATYGKLMAAMYAKMCNAAEENKIYMAENESLKKFKADYDAAQMNYAIDATLKEAKDNSNLTVEELDSAREDAKNFSLETVDGWKNKVFAMAFAKKKTGKTEDVGPKKYAFAVSPFSGSEKVVDSPWTGKVQAQ